MKGEKIGRIGLAVYPKNPQIVYAIVDNNTPLPAKEKKDSSYEKADLKDLTKDQFASLNDARLDSFLKKNRFPKTYTAAGIKERVAKENSVRPPSGTGWTVTMGFKTPASPVVRSIAVRTEVSTGKNT